MNITHVFVRFPHPYQPYNEKLLERQRAGGLNVFVFSLYGRNAPAKMGLLRKAACIVYSVVRMGMVMELSRRTGRSLAQSMIGIGKVVPLLRSAPDLIHIHNIHLLNHEFISVLEMMKVPWVVSIRGSDIAVRPIVDEGERRFVVDVMKRASGVHAVSRSLKEVATAWGISPDHIKVIRRPFDQMKQIDGMAKFDEAAITLTLVGRYHWSKGMIFAVQALKILSQKGVRATLHIAGSGEKGVETELRYWASLLGVSEWIQFHGFVNEGEIDRLLSKTNICIQPSISEGIPNTLIRAVFNRIPIVASRVGGIPELISENEGILVPPADSQALADAIERIAADRTFRENLYRQRSNSIMSGEDEVSEYRAWYESVITKRPHPRSQNGK